MHLKAESFQIAATNGSTRAARQPKPTVGGPGSRLTQIFVKAKTKGANLRGKIHLLAN
jgi:hypothetical protein